MVWYLKAVPVSAKFTVHPFTKESLFKTNAVQCFSLKELVAEKLRAAATRLTIAPRDFYDLGYLLRIGFDLSDRELLTLFRKKLVEDDFSSDLETYRINLGRSDQEIRDMSNRIEAELLDVLTPKERQSFDLAQTLRGINNALRDIS